MAQLLGVTHQEAASFEAVETSFACEHARIDRAVSHLASPGRLASPRTRGLFLMLTKCIKIILDMQS